ncbi:hypothetical protein EVAR_66624_1 [Eumeta japonica]|uniref:Uncharacterized protein n=1 Tax=Eumeta variegata TaxID=151549 RepID=A0A4C1ZQ48_EUMVA|nr:hypothetical protein EVAR_66624_1 [Eumeta japonica]
MKLYPLSLFITALTTSNVADDLREGCPTVTTEDNISAYRKVVYQQIYKSTNNYLGTLGLAHPPYSRVVSLCDFYLFPKIKEKLPGTWFMDADEARAAYEMDIEVTPKCE